MVAEGTFWEGGSKSSRKHHGVGEITPTQGGHVINSTTGTIAGEVTAPWAV